jgi:hypothetical protein
MQKRSYPNFTIALLHFFDFYQKLFSHQFHFSMKRFTYPLACVLVFCLLQAFKKFSMMESDITGAWRIEQGGIDHIVIYQDGYFTQTVFDKKNKIFVGTMGGTYNVKTDSIAVNIEFNSKGGQGIGKRVVYSFIAKDDELILDMDGHPVKMKRIDNGKYNLAGLWRITGRMQNGDVVQMQRGDRKTLKILSGTRFQWMAVNPVTKEFFGTGGGVYTFKDGKYTETIEFFSRDSSRVGASLTFDGSLTGDVWNHKGLSSKGDPIHELWTREKQ